MWQPSAGDEVITIQLRQSCSSPPLSFLSGSPNYQEVRHTHIKNSQPIRSVLGVNAVDHLGLFLPYHHCLEGLGVKNEQRLFPIVCYLRTTRYNIVLNRDVFTEIKLPASLLETYYFR